MMAKKAKHKRFYNFKRSQARDRSFLDLCGARTEPSVTEGLTSAESFLRELVEEVGLREGVTLEHLQDAWAEIVGHNIAQNSEPLEIYEGRLKIRVSQPVIKFELQQRKSKLLKNIQEALPQAKVKDLNIVV